MYAIGPVLLANHATCIQVNVFVAKDTRAWAVTAVRLAILATLIVNAVTVIEREA